VTITRQRTTDFGSRGILSLADVSLPSGRVLGSDGSAVAAHLRDRTLLGSVAYQCGVLEAALELTAQYTRERVQFDRPIGSFQAVAQRLADAYIDTKGVRLTLWQAAFRMATDEAHE